MGGWVGAGEAALLGDDQVHCPADAFVVHAYGNDIMTVMGHRGGDGAALQTEILYKRFGDGSGTVSIDYNDLEDIFFRIAL
jgi:hypothetical protein